MEKRYYKSKIVKLNDLSYLNGEFKLNYFILISKFDFGNGILKKIYGIEVIKEYTDNVGNCFSQSRDITSVSHSETEIYELAKLAFLKNATPTSIDEIVSSHLNNNDFCVPKLLRNFA